MPDLKSHEVLDSILRDINNRSVQEFHQGEKSACFEPKLSDNDEILEAGEQFSLDNYQVVRREFFAHLSEPAVTFYNCKFYVNAACLHRFPGVDYVQALVNQEKKVLVLLPCEEGARDAVPGRSRGAESQSLNKLPVNCLLTSCSRLWSGPLNTATRSWVKSSMLGIPILLHLI